MTVSQSHAPLRPTPPNTARQTNDLGNKLAFVRFSFSFQAHARRGEAVRGQGPRPRIREYLPLPRKVNLPHQLEEDQEPQRRAGGLTGPRGESEAEEANDQKGKPVQIGSVVHPWVRGLGLSFGLGQVAANQLLYLRLPHPAPSVPPLSGGVSPLLVQASHIGNHLP